MNTKLKLLDGTKMGTVGICSLQCRIRDKFHEIPFYLVKEEVQPILGVKTCLEKGLITINICDNYRYCTKNVNSVSTDQLLEEFSDIFEGTGCIGDKCRIEID